MCRGFLISFLLCVSLCVSAQITELTHGQIVIPGYVETPGISVHVLDSLSKEPMPGASVVIASVDDTLTCATDKYGDASFNNIFKKDSVTVTVSFLGYKEESRKMVFSKLRVSLLVKMKEDPMQLNSIIVRDNAVAMVIHGDTTVYNAAAFRTMDGDPLKKLLEKLPGVEFKGGDLYAGGERIAKILVNGTTLFGNNVDAAMRLLYSDEVKSVKLYEQHDQDRLVEADTLKRKEKVMDVQTKKPKTKVVGASVILEAGMFTDKNNDGKYDPIGAIAGGYNYFEVDRPKIVSSFNAGKNSIGGSPASSPVENAEAFVNVGGIKTRKLSYLHDISVNYRRTGSESETSDIYDPAPDFHDRLTRFSRVYSDGNLDITYMGQNKIRIGEKDKLTVQIFGKYSGKRSSWYNNTFSRVDGTESVTDVTSDNSGNAGSVVMSVTYYRPFSKVRRSLNMKLEYSGSFGGSKGERTDTTMKTSSVPQWLTNRDSQWSHTPSVSVTYSEPLAKKLSFIAGYSFKGTFSFSERLSFDELLQSRDFINTYRYTNRSISNRVSAGLRYGLNSDKFSVMFNVSYINLQQMRHETLPQIQNHPKEYHHIAPALTLSYRHGTFRLDAKYLESPSVPSVEQLRAVVDYSNPLYLVAGNPSLKLPVWRDLNVSMNLSSVLISTNWSLEFDYSERNNAVANKIVFFPEQTCLPEYNYTAIAGSQLSLPVNVNGSRVLQTGLKASVFSTPLKSTFTPGISWHYERNPFFSQDVRHDNRQHEIMAELMYQSGFSSHIEIFLYNITRFGRNLRDKDKVYDYVNESVNGSVRANFLKCLWVQAECIYNLMRPTGNYDGYENLSLGVHTGVKFGKDNHIELMLHCTDLLNSVESRSISVMDGYTREAYNAVFGRGCIISFKYKFK